MAPRDDELVRVHRAAWQGGSSSSRQRVRRLSQESVFDPLFTMRSDRQPVATHGNDFRVSEPFWGRPICHRLPLVAPARLFLKTGALSSARLADVTPLVLPDVGCSSLSWPGCTPCRWELSRLLSSIRGRQAAKAKRELAGTGVPAVVRGADLKGWLRESMCQAAIRILRVTAALAELVLPERPATSR
jgi:hypothetical protein